ncbi:glycosyltransferase family 4 protein [Niveibacterium sp. 24ML]|uniref:glycosyltransferase family 4 protein n=1 Tax=Niveibacterium sp. 24ML TaxID=2985512 RepID=UPI0022701E7D|nr:glycosyltransferase family 4 protein [Niveibacterium sp. 24ML]MCX9158081.1 glycosyltransferase family 4 protein [Niveibacterium sp. 24ML]
MKIAVIHQNFPGQFRHLCAHLAQRADVQLVAIGHESAPGMPGVALRRYTLHRKPTEGVHHYVVGFERAVLYGQAVARELHDLKAKGFEPDVVIAHPGWGEALLVKDVFPHTRLINFCEYYYRAEGADADFDPAHPLRFDDRARITTRNALHLLNLELCDVGVAPTAWQRSLHPHAYRHKIHTLHEGIDIAGLAPDPAARMELPNGTVVRAGDEVITYVARNLEPYRGFPSFMSALPAVLQARPNAQVLIVGGDEVSYGSKPKGHASWREAMLAELDLPEALLARVHFLGKLAYPDYKRVLQLSAAHVYLTYPFVLSWSMLEAMASGCLVIGSATAPVQEVIRDGQNGVLVDFFDVPGIAARVIAALTHPERFAPLRVAGRALVRERYPLAAGVRGYLDLIGLPQPRRELAKGRAAAVKAAKMPVV